MKKTFLHISEEFEYTWLGKDNGMIPIYMSLLFFQILHIGQS